MIIRRTILHRFRDTARSDPFADVGGLTSGSPGQIGG
jgi:hypothetical protein